MIISRSSTLVTGALGTKMDTKLNRLYIYFGAPEDRGQGQELANGITYPSNLDAVPVAV